MGKDDRFPSISLTCSPDEDAASRFLSALGSLPVDAWLQAATSARENSLARCAALASINTLARRGDCCLPMWRLDDDFQTVLWYRFSYWSISHRTQSAILEAADVARRAASAVLLRKHLRRQHFSALYGPFEDSVPLR